MKKVMLHLRDQPPVTIGGTEVLRIADLLDEEQRTPATYTLGGPRDMITFFLSEDSRTRITIRPSGTEPKMKYYIQAYAPFNGDLRQDKEAVDSIAHALGQDILDHSRAGLPNDLQMEWSRSVQRVL